MNWTESRCRLLHDIAWVTLSCGPAQWTVIGTCQTCGTSWTGAMFLGREAMN